MFRRPVSVIRILNKSLARTLYTSAHSEAVSPKFLSLRVTSLLLPARQLSCITQRKVDYRISMQPVPEKSTAGGQEEPRAEQSGTAARKEPTAGRKKEKKVKQVKSPKKGRGRKQKENVSASTENLLAELPFANTVIWKELGFAGGESSRKEKKRKRAEKGRVESEEDGEKEKKKQKGCPRPNYFVSIPITNQKIKQGVEELQAEVLQKDPRLSRALIPVGTLHITLLVTHLATQEEVETAAAALQEMEPSLRTLLGGRSLVLPFRGIGHFRQEVAFIQISEGEHLSTLSSIADSVRRVFEEKGVSPGDQKDFKPHLTFIKLSRAPKLRRQNQKTAFMVLTWKFGCQYRGREAGGRLQWGGRNRAGAGRQEGIKKLDTALYAPFEQREFGEESACTLDLCSMLKKKSADGYYHREKTVTFGEYELLHRLEHPHTVPADGAVGVEVEGHQAFWTCDNKRFILVLTTVPPPTDSLGVSTKTKAGLAQGYFTTAEFCKAIVLWTAMLLTRTTGRTGEDPSFVADFPKGSKGPELDDEELMSLSKRLVEDAVLRAVQQYMEETQQNGTAPKDGAPPPLTTNK
ncbi:hypothetical protein NFI96_022346 [Prochilodus magdalenae]|nr:hypothetical protein NFI96_022346 [Prochilodus magdalenae]